MVRAGFLEEVPFELHLGWRGHWAAGNGRWGAFKVLGPQGCSHGLEGSCGRTVSPQPVILRQAPPDTGAVGVTGAGPLLCSRPPHHPWGSACLRPGRPSLSHHVPGSACGTSWVETCVEVTGRGCQPTQGVRSCPMRVTSQDPNPWPPSTPGSAVGLGPGTCAPGVTEPRAAQAPRRGQKPQNDWCPGRSGCWEDFLEEERPMALRGGGEGCRGRWACGEPPHPPPAGW